MKKVLIITYYWPPAGGPGVQRVLKFAKYLPEFGWEPVILTVENGEYPAIDTSLLEEIPPNIKVYKTQTLEPFSLYKRILGKGKDHQIGTFVLAEKQQSISGKLSNWARFNFFIPDARIGWKRFAIKAGLNIIQKEGIDLIFSSSPPHSLQLAAKKIAKRSKKPWVADFRDPWSEIVFNQEADRSRLTKNIDQKLERKVLNSSNGLITVSSSILKTLKQKINSSKKCDVISNGYDFSPSNKTPEDIFTISYTGVLSETRIPHPLLPVLKELKNEGIKFNLRLIGNTCPEMRNLLKHHNLEDNCEEIAYIPHSEVVNYLEKSHALLLVIDNVPDNTGILTGKLFEYIGMKKPIIAIGNLNGDANKIIMDCDCGQMFDYSDSEGIKVYIQKLYNTRKQNKTIHSFNRIEKYSRKNLTQQLARFFNSFI